MNDERDDGDEIDECDESDESDKRNGRDEKMKGTKMAMKAIKRDEGNESDESNHNNSLTRGSGDLLPRRLVRSVLEQFYVGIFHRFPFTPHFCEKGRGIDG